MNEILQLNCISHLSFPSNIIFYVYFNFKVFESKIHNLILTILYNIQQQF
jgi:hypothetical protein